MVYCAHGVIKLEPLSGNLYNESLAALLEAISTSFSEAHTESIKNMAAALVALTEQTKEILSDTHFAEAAAAMTKLQAPDSVQISTITSMLTAFAKAASRDYIGDFTYAFDAPFPSIAKAVEAAEEALPLVSFDQAEEPPIFPLPEEARTKKSWWTFERVMALLSLLITIYFGILHSMPDKQMSKIIEQNSEIIENQKDELDESKESDQQIREALQDLSECISNLTEELDALREQPNALHDVGDDSNNLTDSEAHTDAADRENQDTQGEN